MSDDLPGYSSGPSSYVTGGTGTTSDASTEPLVHPSNSFSRTRKVSDAPPPSRVSLLASQYEAIDRPPSAPHRSYNPSNYQAYNSSVPTTISPTASLSRRSRAYIPFSADRVSGRRAYSPAPQLDPIWAPPSSVHTSTADWDSGVSGVGSGRQYDNRPGTPSSVHTRTSHTSRSSRPLPPDPPSYRNGRGLGERRYDAQGEYEGGGFAEEEMDAKLRLDAEEMYDRDYMEHIDPDMDDLDDIDDEGDHRNPRSSRHYDRHRRDPDDESIMDDDFDSRYDREPIKGGLGSNPSMSEITLQRTLSEADLSTLVSLHSKTPLSSATPAPADDISAAGEHYGPAPKSAQTRRGLHHKAIMKKKQVKLTRGELILDCRIPSILYSFLPRKNDMEFTHMRYTAVTCDPDDFVNKGYMLRQNLDTTARETELFICVTMYNEDEVHFTRTMHGIMRNVAHFCSRTKSRVWGKEGWQKIVVGIVSDGRKKVHPRVLDALAAMGVYQDGIAKNLVNGRQVTAHVYEYTTQVSLDSDMKFKGAEKGIVPVQMLFCLKEQNSKKLNSHRWCFNAFGRALNPNVCIMLDVGTRPGPTSLYHLWKAFDTDSNVGGACGEIKAMKGKGWLGLFNPLVASQNFEYKMSNILDKPLESVFGYITVLPGALSAYRYHALQNDENGHGPLSQYFKGEKLHGKDADIFTANMYLAEDRILCWELVAKRNERWVLKYVRSATGETDVPDAVPEFVSQRRRWLNGALFAALYSLIHFRQIWTTDHTLVRKVLLHVEFFYQFISLLFTYFSLANFYLTFYFVSGALSDPLLDPFGHGIGARIFTLLKLFMLLLISTQFILSMGNRPQGAKKMFTASMASYAVIMMYTTFASLYIVIKALTKTSPAVATETEIGNNVFTNLIISTASTIGIYFLMSLLYLDPWHMFTSSAQYFMMLPSYIVTLQVYAFCNTHDVSWGTKGDNVIHTDLGAAISGGKGGEMVELEMPSEQLDIDSGYDEALRNLRDRLEVPGEPVSSTQEHEDYYRAVRTYMVVIWMVANGVLAMGITEAFNVDQVGGNWYLTFLLWAVAAVAFFRALGSMAYLVIEMMYGLVEGKFRIDISGIKERFEPPWKRIQKVNAKANEKAQMQGP